MHTRKPRSTNKILLAESESPSEELKVRCQADPEQLSLLGDEELAKLERPPDRHLPQEGEVQPSEINETDGSARTDGDAIQLKLPGF